MKLDLDGDETTVEILAVDLAMVSDGAELALVRQKLESSQKPFEFTPEELTALIASLEGLQKDERGRGFTEVLGRVRSTIANADQ